MTITENVALVRQRMLSAEAAAGTAPGSTLLVAATKMNDAARVREAILAGVDACGENRVQELTEKNAQGAYAGKPLHFIGHLQRNKVRQVVGVCSLIESVDSAELISLIGKRAVSLGITQDILLEVNIGGELSKSGVSPDELPALLEAAASTSGIQVRGLMAIPPISTISGQNRPFFARMRQLWVDIGSKKYNNVIMDFLSMGMSGDFEDAILEGSNMVRVGTAIFGARNYDL